MLGVEVPDRDYRPRPLLSLHNGEKILLDKGEARECVALDLSILFCFSPPLLHERMRMY
jgi:hypothetical protein